MRLTYTLLGSMLLNAGAGAGSGPCQAYEWALALLVYKKSLIL